MASASCTRPDLQPSVGLGFYCRLAKLLLSVGTHTLCRLLVNIVGDVGVFLRDQQVLTKLKKNKHIQSYQWKVISPQGATANVEEFDITLLSALLLNVCNLSDGHMSYISDLRQHRNKLCHSHDAYITRKDFEKKWEEVSDTLCNIAQLCGPAFRVEIEKEITDLKSAPIDVSRDQRYFQILLEHCLRERDFQHAILAQQSEANEQLQQIIYSLSLLEQRSESRQIIQNLKEVSDLMTECAQSNEDKSAICSLLMEDMNIIIDNHFSSFKGIMQENKQSLKRIEKKLDILSRERSEERKPVVKLSLIDDALLDKVTDGIKKIPGKIVQWFTPIDHSIALTIQNQDLTSAVLESSLMTSENTKDSKDVTNVNTSEDDKEMDEEYRMEMEKDTGGDISNIINEEYCIIKSSFVFYR